MALTEILGGIGGGLIAAGRQYAHGKREEEDRQRMLADRERTIKEHEADRAFQATQQKHALWSQERQRTDADLDTDYYANQAQTVLNTGLNLAPLIQDATTNPKFTGVNAEEPADQQETIPGTNVPVPYAPQTTMQSPQPNAAPTSAAIPAQAQPQGLSSAGFLPPSGQMKGKAGASTSMKPGPIGKTPVAVGTVVLESLNPSLKNLDDRYVKLQGQLKSFVGPAPDQDSPEYQKWKLRAAAGFKKFESQFNALSVEGQGLLNTAHANMALHRIGQRSSEIMQLPWDNPDALKASVESLIAKYPTDPYLPLLRDAKRVEINMGTEKRPNIIEVFDINGMQIDDGELIAMGNGSFTPDDVKKLGQRMKERHEKMLAASSLAEGKNQTTVTVAGMKPRSKAEIDSEGYDEAEKENRMAWDAIKRYGWNDKLGKSPDEWAQTFNGSPEAKAEVGQLIGDIRYSENRMKKYNRTFDLAEGRRSKEAIAGLRDRGMRDASEKKAVAAATRQLITATRFAPTADGVTGVQTLVNAFPELYAIVPDKWKGETEDKVRKPTAASPLSRPQAPQAQVSTTAKFW